LLILVLQL